MRLALLASGRGSNVAAILDAIADGRLRAEPVLLLCDRPGRSGHRHRDACRRARRARSSVGPSDPGGLGRGGAGGADGRPVPTSSRSPASPRSSGRRRRRVRWTRILNIHPSLLPAFAGIVAPGPQAAALAAGVPVSGCTVHLVTADVDAGPILAQAEVPVLPGDTVDSLSDRILAAEHRLYPQVLARFIEATAPQARPSTGSLPRSG